MPFVRHQVPNVYGLRQTELHRKVNQEDSETSLDGVAASGLVGILRQIGDLTEFAAEIFHGIQEEVMVTASRSSNLKTRLIQLEVTVPSFHKTLLPLTNHLHFAYTAGLEWHPRIPNLQNHFINNDLPQFIMGPYQDCRDPPQLHLLDKFDINGPGSCLKRYSDPTHFKIASKLPGDEMKKCVPQTQSRAISRLASMPNQSDRKTLTSLSFGGRTSSSKTASTIGIESKSDLQDLPSCSFDSKSVAEKPKGLFTSSRFTRTIASVLSESESDSESENANGSPYQDLTAHGSSCEKAEVVECAKDEPSQIMETGFVLDTLDDDKTTDARQKAVQDVKMRDMEMEMEMEMDMDSEGDDFVDALYTIDSESETDEEMEKNSTNLRVVGETKCAAESDRDPSGMCNGAHNYSNGFSNPLYDDISGIQEHQESEDETCCDTKLWSNGNLLDPKPSVGVTIPENDAAETFQEPLKDYKEAPFDWFTSSPPLGHMKISFNPSETLPSSELKLKLRDEYTFSSFQLVPETAADSDSDKDTFCRSSSYSGNHSEQQWEEEEEEGERKSNAAPYPEIETWNHSAGIHSYLQNPAEPLPPPLPPLQWMVSNKKQSLEHKNSLSTINKQNSNIVTASSHPKPLNNVHQKNNLREFTHSQTEAGDFLHQIRTKQFKLRRVVTGRTSSSEATTNTNINLILEKANSIRQAVASDDGDGESNTWSDSDT